MVGLLFSLSFFVVLAVWYGFSSWQHKRTLYYMQTHNSFLATYLNKGLYGEFLTWKNLERLDGHKRFLFNCYLPKDNGETTEIDVILLHESGVYVLESKNYSGWIFGDENQAYWTQTLPAGRGRSKKARFFNPILQNKVHLKWLSQYLGQAPDTFFSYIVFSNRCTLKKVTLTNGQHHVVNRNALLAAVKSNVRKTGHLLTADEIDQLYTKLEPLTQVSEVQKLAHIQAIQAKQPAAKAKTCKKPAVAGSEAARPQPVPQGAADTPPVCPRCGGMLILRTATKGKKAGTRFWGCTNYPKCRYTQPSSS